MTESTLQRELFEIRIALAGRYMLIRVRATSPEDARTIVLGHHPGWDHVETTRWAGEGWVEV